MPGPLVWAALALTAGSALNAKVEKNRRPDPLTDLNASASGAGTSGGAALDIEDIIGTVVAGDDITPFEYKAYDEQGMTEEDQLMALMQQLSPEQSGGVMSAATGKYLSRGKGGGITFELLQQLFGSEKLKESGFDSIEDMLAANTPPVDEIVASSGNAIPMPDQQVGINKPEINPNIGAELPREMGTMENAAYDIKGFAKEHPAQFMAIANALGTALTTALGDEKPQAPSRLDSRPLMAGNANRRAAQMNVKPIGGTQYAKHGGTLNRPMFMPDGGAMRGPGGPKEDLIPVMASNGEYMLSKAAVDQAGSGNHNKGIARLNAFNNQGNKRYG